MRTRVKLLLVALGAMAAPAVAQPSIEMDGATVGMIQATINLIEAAAGVLAVRGLPYVLSLHAALVLVDLAFWLYRNQGTDWLYGFFWRLIAHLMMRTAILWSVTPNPLTGSEGWGYSVASVWAHVVGRQLTSGEVGGGLSLAGFLVPIFGFIAALVAKVWEVMTGGMSLLIGVLAPFVYLSFWISIVSLLLVAAYTLYVSIDALLVAFAGFFALAFYGSEFTSGLGNRYVSAVVERGLKILLAYFMLGLGLVLVEDVWTPYVEAMNPQNPLAWTGLTLMVALYAFFAVWRLPRTLSGLVAGDAIRLDAIFHTEKR